MQTTETPKKPVYLDGEIIGLWREFRMSPSNWVLGVDSIVGDSKAFMVYYVNDKNDGMVYCDRMDMIVEMKGTLTAKGSVLREVFDRLYNKKENPKPVAPADKRKQLYDAMINAAKAWMESQKQTNEVRTVAMKARDEYQKESNLPWGVYTFDAPTQVPAIPELNYKGKVNLNCEFEYTPRE